MRVGPVLAVLIAAVASVFATENADTLDLAKRCAEFNFDKWAE